MEAHSCRRRKTKAARGGFCGRGKAAKGGFIASIIIGYKEVSLSVTCAAGFFLVKVRKKFRRHGKYIPRYTQYGNNSVVEMTFLF